MKCIMPPNPRYINFIEDCLNTNVKANYFDIYKEDINANTRFYVDAWKADTLWVLEAYITRKYTNDYVFNVKVRSKQDLYGSLVYIWTWLMEGVHELSLG